MSQDEFVARVTAVVEEIPAGGWLSYGTVALMAGRPHGAREVGRIASGSRPPASLARLPWHRVLYAGGRLVPTYPGGSQIQEQLLAAEGVVVRDGKVVD